MRDCAGTVTSEGWIDLTTGVWSAGPPPAGAVACGDSRSIQVSGTFCDLAPDGTVLGLVLVEYSYAADGAIDGVRLVDAVTGDTYTPQGEVTTCPAGVEQPERDAVVLCDVTDDESGTVLSTPFVRDYARDENGAIAGHSDYTLDGEPYVPAGTVGICQPAVDEPCPLTVTTLRLCDLNPDVQPDDEGRRCATPILTHLVHDCTGALVERRYTTADGREHTPVQVVDCGTGGLPAMVEVPWTTASVVEDPDGVPMRDFIFTVSPEGDPETVGTVRVSVSRDAGGACGPYDINNLVFSNTARYVITLDETARQMSYLRVDLIDFDAFEPVQIITGTPEPRLGGTAVWNEARTRIVPTENDGAGYLYWDTPPERIEYQIWNTGGGTSCSALSFQGMTLEPEGCCGGCGQDDAGEPGVDVETDTMCILDAAGELVGPVLVERVYDDQSGERIEQRLVDPLSGDLVELPEGATLGPCAAPQAAAGDTEVLHLCDIGPDGQVLSEFARRVVYDADGQPQTVTDTALDLVTPYEVQGEAGRCPPEPECPVAFSTECVGVVQRSEAAYDNTSLIGGVPGQCGSVQGPGGQFPCQPPDGGEFAIVSWVVDGQEVIGEGAGRSFGGGPCGPGTDAEPGMHRQWAEALTNLDPSGVVWTAQEAEGCAWYVGSAGGTDTVYGPMVVVGTSHDGVPNSRWVLGPAQACVETQYTRVYSQDCDGAITVSWLDAQGAPVQAPEGDYVACGTGCRPGGGAGGCCDCPQHLAEVCRWDDTDGDGVGDVRFVELVRVDSCTGETAVVGTYTADWAAPYEPVSPVDSPVGDVEPARGVQAQRLALAPGEVWDAGTVPLLQGVTAVAHAGTGTITTAAGESPLHEAESVSWAVGRDDAAALTGPLVIAADTGTVTVSWTHGVEL